MKKMKPPRIWIEAYTRIRNGVLELVRGHYRRLPGYV